MLARYLATRTPVRYAMDPAHAEAMRNFLALHTRAYDLPHLALVAAPHLQHPLLQQLLQAVLGEHDPAALAGTLDVANEALGLQPPSVIYHPTDSVLNTPSGGLGHRNHLMTILRGLHGVLSGETVAHTQGNFRMPSPEEIHARYATGALQDLNPPANAHAWFQQTHVFPDHVQGILRLAGQQGGRNPLNYIPAYDVAHEQAQGSYIPHTARRVRELIATSLRQGVIPHLHEGL